MDALKPDQQYILEVNGQLSHNIQPSLIARYHNNVLKVDIDKIPSVLVITYINGSCSIRLDTLDNDNTRYTHRVDEDNKTCRFKLDKDILYTIVLFSTTLSTVKVEVI